MASVGYVVEVEVPLRCIFCKKASDASSSVEHIIPESLGNTVHTLPPGVVCDKCNNYFAREVEKPFLDSGVIRKLRAEQSLPKKNGKLLGLEGVLWPGHPATVYFPPHGTVGLPVLDLESPGAVRALNRAARRKAGAGRSGIAFPGVFDPPDDHVASRLLAKMALEAFTKRGMDYGLDYEYVVDESQLDPVRNHARIGDPRVKWPYHIRQIYDANKPWVEADGSVVQRKNEYDILVTENWEYYFVVAIFGLELTINLGGPNIEGYEAWLAKHENASPLYYGKNATGERIPEELVEPFQFTPSWMLVTTSLFRGR